MHENEISDIKFKNLLYLKQIYNVHKTFTREFNPFLFTMLKYCQKNLFMTVVKHYKTTVAFSDNKLTLLIRAITTLLE